MYHDHPTVRGAIALAVKSGRKRDCTESEKCKEYNRRLWKAFHRINALPTMIAREQAKVERLRLEALEAMSRKVRLATVPRVRNSRNPERDENWARDAIDLLDAVRSFIEIISRFISARREQGTPNPDLIKIKNELEVSKRNLRT